MKPHHLEPGVYHVHIRDRSRQNVIGDFNLSVFRLNGMNVVAGFDHGQPRPPIGKHIMLTEGAREWVDSMDRVIEP